MTPKLLKLPISLQSQCSRKYGWEITFAKKALKGYQHFMRLKKLHEDWNATQLSPSLVVDQVWHMHMMDPRHYVKACQEYCDGEIIGHNPDGGMDYQARKQRRKNTKFGLISMLGKRTLDADIWGSLDEGNVQESKNPMAEPKDAEEGESDDDSQVGDYHSDNFVTICIREMTGKKTDFRVPRNMPLEKTLFKKFVKYIGTGFDDFRYIYAQKQMVGHETPNSLSMQEGSTVHAIARMRGC